jgi:hypothetical protein
VFVVVVLYCVQLSSEVNPEVNPDIVWGDPTPIKIRHYNELSKNNESINNELSINNKKSTTWVFS